MQHLYVLESTLNTRSCISQRRQMSECRSVGGATRLPSIQPPDESICGKRRRCQLCIVFTGCINPASHPLLGRSKSVQVRKGARAEENVGTFDSSKLRRREFKAERGLILSQPAAVRTMCLSEGVRAHLRARMNARKLTRSHTHPTPLPLHTCTTDPSSTRLSLSVSLQKQLVCLCFFVSKCVCVCARTRVSV